MKKVVMAFLLFVGFSILGTGFAMDKSALTYEELLTLYFGVLTPSWNQSVKPELNYTNLDKDTKLYGLLQIAVGNNKFPNLSIELPLKNPAYESDLALLIKNNFQKNINYTQKKKLSFNYLLTELKSVYKADNNSLVIEKVDQPSSEISNEDIANSILALLKYNFINKDKLSDTKTLNYEDIPSLLESLGEEYTEYYNPEEGKNFMDTLNGEFAGIGVYLIQNGNGNPMITEVIKNSPAEKAGLKANDEILSINGKTLEKFSNIFTFIDALKGEVGTSVMVQIRRGTQILNKEIKRAIIQIPMVESENIGGICYINIVSFDLGSKNMFLKAFDKLGRCDKFVFDVRSNPGGVIDEVTGVLDKFIEKGKVIMTERGSDEEVATISNETPIYSLDKPTSILIDSNTASSAEIFAGVLKYYFPTIVKLVGTQSYGKGSVQQVVQFPNNSIIKYTTAIWYIADQLKSIDKIGLTPDIYAVDNPYTIKDEVLEKVGISQ